MSLNRPALVPTIALSITTALWGSTFFLSKELVARHDAASVLTVRFAIAVAVMLALQPYCLRALSRKTWTRGLVLGGFYGLAQLPQFYGLSSTSASTAGFLIGSYVVFTPLFGYLIYRVVAPRITYAGVAVATLGLAVVTLQDWHIGAGEALMLVSAVLYAAQIVALSAWSLPGEAWSMTVIQMIGITVVVGVAAVVAGWDPPTSSRDWWIVVYLAVIASALAIGVQTWAQSRLAATHAAVIMAAEPVWAAGLAVIFTSEVMTRNIVVGGILLIGANVLITLKGSPVIESASPPDTRDECDRTALTREQTDECVPRPPR